MFQKEMSDQGRLQPDSRPASIESDGKHYLKPDVEHHASNRAWTASPAYRSQSPQPYAR